MTEVEPTVFVVDDEPAVRHSLEMLMRSVRVPVESFASAEEFLGTYEPDRPGCLVLDVRMPGMSGLELQRVLEERKLPIPVIVITGHGDVPVAVDAMRSGAVDFLQKPFSQQVLLERVREALRLDGQRRARWTRCNEIHQRLRALTRRERQVLELIAGGSANKQVAAELGISQKTVEVHRANVMRKMAAQSLADLVEQVVTVNHQQ